MGKLRLEPFISVGTILQMLALLLSFVGLYNKMDKTLAVHAEKLSQQERRIVVLENLYLKNYGNAQRN